MSDLTPAVPESNSDKPASPQGISGSPGEAERNGAVTPPPPSGGTGTAPAEEIVDRVAARVASLADTVWGKTILTIATRAREAAQDFWAEVQDVRHGKRP